MITKKRKFIDGCSHKEGEYIGTISFINDERKETFLDVYVFVGTLGDEVCVRYGDAPSQYYSPTDLFTFLCDSRSAEYRKAIEVLRENGKLKYVKSRW